MKLRDRDVAALSTDHCRVQIRRCEHDCSHSFDDPPMHSSIMRRLTSIRLRSGQQEQIRAAGARLANTHDPEATHGHGAWTAARRGVAYVGGRRAGWRVARTGRASLAGGAARAVMTITHPAWGASKAADSQLSTCCHQRGDAACKYVLLPRSTPGRGQCLDVRACPGALGCSWISGSGGAVLL